MLEEILFLSPTSGSGGYERHARGVLQELVKHVQVQHICLPYEGKKVQKTPEMTEIIEKALKTQVSPFAPALWLTLPSNVKYIPGRSLINFTAWEATRICPAWVLQGRAVDLTLVPTQFLKQVWVDSGVPEEKVEVVNEGTDVTLFNLEVKPLLLLHRDKLVQEVFEYRFLSVLQLSNRKNFRNALSAFVKAFEGRKDVCLILKVSYMERQKDLEYYTNGIDLSKVNVLVCDQILSEDMMPSFLANATHYYTLSCGEGWDLSCVDCGALKKTIVAPHHSAYTEYLTDERAFLIKKYKRVPAKQDNVLDGFFEGSEWFLPDVEEAVEVLRDSIESSTKEEKAKNFYEHVKNNLTWEIVGEKLMEILNSKF